MLSKSAAAAQVGLPSVRLPELPGVTLPNLPAAGLPLDIDKSAAALAGEIDPRRLRELRALRIRELLRRHRDVLEADPHGAPIVRGEVLALSPSAAALQAAGDAGFSVVREHSFAELGTRIVVLHAPGNTTRAMARLQALDPAGVYDFNHLYTDSGAVTADDTHAAQPAPAPGGVTRAEQADGVAAIRLGLIDSGVEATHEVFRGITIQQHGCTHPLPAEHGTAVASLMVGRASAFQGAAPGSALYAVDVFCGMGGIGGTMNGGAGGSIGGGGGGQLDGLGRIDRTPDGDAQDVTRAGARSAGKAEGSARHDAGKSETDAHKAGSLAGNVAADTASSAAASASGALSGALSASGAASNTGMSAVSTRQSPGHGENASARRGAIRPRVRVPRVLVTPGSPRAVATLTRVSARTVAAGSDTSASASADASMNASTAQLRRA